jgi:hypothetical protein
MSRYLIKPSLFLLLISFISCQNKVRELVLKIDEPSTLLLNNYIEQARDIGIILPEQKKWVSAQILVNDSTVPIKVKLKGDMLDHVNHPFRSLRVKYLNNQYSLLDPVCRSYHQEYLFHEVLLKEGVLATKYEFVTVSLNKQPYFCAKEEHFTDSLLILKNRKNGPLFRINENRMWEKRTPKNGAINYRWEESICLTLTEEINFYSNSSDSIVLQKAGKLFNDFRHGIISVDSCFDMDLISKFWAISNIFKADHALVWSNMRFYYNPTTKKIEPIGYDGYSDRLEDFNLGFRGSEMSHEQVEFHHLFLRDNLFLEKYHAYLHHYSSSVFINEMEAHFEKNLRRLTALFSLEDPLVPKWNFYKENLKKVRVTLNDFSFPFTEGRLVVSEEKIKSISKKDSLYKEHVKIILNENHISYQNYFHRSVSLKHGEDSIFLPAYNYDGYPETVSIPN